MQFWLFCNGWLCNHLSWTPAACQEFRFEFENENWIKPNSLVIMESCHLYLAYLGFINKRKYFAIAVLQWRMWECTCGSVHVGCQKNPTFFKWIEIMLTVTESIWHWIVLIELLFKEFSKKEYKFWLNFRQEKKVKFPKLWRLFDLRFTTHIDV